VRNKAGQRNDTSPGIAPGADLRGDGGYCIAWFLHGCELVAKGAPADWPACSRKVRSCDAASSRLRMAIRWMRGVGRSRNGRSICRNPAPRDERDHDAPDLPSVNLDTGLPTWESDERSRNRQVVSPAAAETAPGKSIQRWSAARKRDVVLRLLRDESVEAVSRQIGIERR
jgi:hypothetical protein